MLATGLATYPDATVVCGRSERDPESPSHVTNPTVVVEVLSKSTADYDRVEKLQHYQQVDSLQSIVLVDHEDTLITLWTQSASGWSSRQSSPNLSEVTQTRELPLHSRGEITSAR